MPNTVSDKSNCDESKTPEAFGKARVRKKSSNSITDCAPMSFYASHLMMTVWCRPLNRNVKFITHRHKRLPKEDRIIINTQNSDSITQRLNPEDHPPPNSRSIRLGLQKFSQMITRAKTYATKSPAITTNSRLMNRTPDINGHSMEGKRRIRVSSGVSANISYRRLTKSA